MAPAKGRRFRTHRDVEVECNDDGKHENRANDVLGHLAERPPTLEGERRSRTCKRWRGYSGTDRQCAAEDAVRAAGRSEEADADVDHSGAAEGAGRIARAAPLHQTKAKGSANVVHGRGGGVKVCARSAR